MVNEYAPLTQLKEMRSVTGTAQDNALLRALERASRAIDRKTGRFFYREGSATARAFSPFGRTIRHPSGSELLLVPDIADPATITVTIGSSAATITARSPELPGDPVTALLHSSWYGGDISVTAEWGWPAVPESIAEATLLLANRRYMRKDSPEGTTGWSQEGSVAVSRFDSDIEDLVQPFVLYGFGA